MEKTSQKNLFFYECESCQKRCQKLCTHNYQLKNELWYNTVANTVHVDDSLCEQLHLFSERRHYTDCDDIFAVILS